MAANVGYVRYFTAHIYEYQFYKALCLVSKQYDPEDPEKPLHRCNFFGSKEAGDKLKSMLELGSSRPWKEAMEVMTGEPKMNTDAFREYFKPLDKGELVLNIFSMWMTNRDEVTLVNVSITF